MTTTRRSSILLFTIAMAGSLVATSQASAGFSGLRAPHGAATPQLAFSFNVSCDEISATGNVSAGWDDVVPDEAADGEFRPRCMMSGDEGGATFFCQCEDNEATIVGSIGAEDIVPDGIFPPVDSVFPPPTPMDLAFRACRRVFKTQCLSLPQDIEIFCQNDAGTCSVEALGHEPSQGYSEMGTGCLCASGEGWYSGEIASQPRSFDEAQASALCQAELRGCAPEGDPRPSDVELFPSSSLAVRSAACTVLDPENEDVPDCYVEDDGEEVRYDCFCGEEVGSVDGSLAVDSGLTRAELYDQCQVVLASECAVVPESPDDPTPEDPGIEDILDGLGCNLNQPGPLRPWLIPVWALCLFALRPSRPTGRNPEFGANAG